MTRKTKVCLVADKHADMGTRVETCWCCHLKIGPSWQERLDAQIAAVPREVHQQIVDLFRAGNNVRKDMYSNRVGDIYCFSNRDEQPH